MNELAKLSIDPQNTFKVREVNIDRDALHLTLTRGLLAFFTPVRGSVVGAVFIGEGEILVMPPNKIEKFQLNKFTGSPILNEKFTSAVFHFTDDTYAQVLRTIQESSPLESAELSLKDAWNAAVHDLSLNLNYRLLESLLAEQPRKFFRASLLGITLGWFEVFFDEQAVEPVLVGRITHGPGGDYADIWTQFRSAHMSTGNLKQILQELQLYDIASVDIDAQISETARLNATAKLTLKFLVAGERLIPFELSRALKLAAVEDEQRQSLDFFQNTLLEASEVGQRGNDMVYVRLDQPTRKDASLTLQFKYSGDVITPLGNGIYFVGERGTWYPNHGLIDYARYHLKFRYPGAMTLVATGNRVSESDDGTNHISEWDSDGEMGVAGFNYGDYLTKTQTVKSTEVAVYANRGLEEVVRNLQNRLERLRTARLAAQQPRPRGTIPLPIPDSVLIPTISTQTLLTNAINDSASALQFFESSFGPYPYRKLAVSQIPGRFGQSWPSLCYVSTFTFLTPAQQSSLEFSRDAQIAFSQTMRAHEIAHQWWGNQVVAQSYHDLWLIEGMANYAALLYAGSKDPREKNFLDAMRHMKEHLLEKTENGQTIESAGPLWLGWRLLSSKTPTGYQEIVYEKGSWVIHMLRMMMRDPRSDSDEAFFSALKEFLNRYKNQTASTEDFKRIVEKHMTPRMDLDGNRKLDWFFEAWVYDVGIPEYRFTYDIKGSKETGYSVTGKVQPSGVPAGFEMPVPVYAHYGSREVFLGNVVVSGEDTSFRFRLPLAAGRPSKITLNNNEAVLAVVKTK